MPEGIPRRETVRFTSADVRVAWDYAAEAWDTFVESGADYYRTEVHGPALLDVCGQVSGLRVLDLGCGQGWCSRALATGGARVIGIDVSEKQITQARRHERECPLGIAYDVLDAATVGDRWPRGSFDLVTACMALHDMEDPAAALRGSWRVLGTKGRLVFSIPNPLTDTPFREWERDEKGEKRALKIDRYFESGARVLHWNMARLKYPWETPYWYRTLGEWTTLIAEARFSMLRILEGRPTPQQVERQPELEDCYRLPYFLIFELQKLEEP